MAGLILDSAGSIKMKVLEDALALVQRINGLVETYALTVKRNQPTGSIAQSIKRQLPTLAANLKNQFGMISDQVTATYMASTRGASEANRVRALREGMAIIKQGIEIAMAQTKDKHAVKKHPDGASEG